jgi:hypothetical protein
MSPLATWFSFTASQVWNTPGAENVIMYTGWCYILVAFLIEPLSAIIKEHFKKPEFSEFEERIKLICQSVSIISNGDEVAEETFKSFVIFTTSESDKNSILRTLYFIDKIIKETVIKGKTEHSGYVIEF